MAYPFNPICDKLPLSGRKLCAQPLISETSVRQHEALSAPLCAERKASDLAGSQTPRVKVATFNVAARGARAVRVANRWAAAAAHIRRTTAHTNGPNRRRRQVMKSMVITSGSSLSCRGGGLRLHPLNGIVPALPEWSILLLALLLVAPN